jgi:hypothetical protein
MRIAARVARARLSPDVGNGVLEVGESTTVTFVIKLATRNRFRFLGTVGATLCPDDSHRALLVHSFTGSKAGQDDVMHRFHRLFDVPLIRRAVLACVAIALLLGATRAGAQGLFTEQATLVAHDALAGDHTGVRVAIDGNTALVSSRRDNPPLADFGFVHVFERDPELNIWQEVTTLPGGRFAISGDTAMVTAGDGVGVFQRNEGGANAWGNVTTLPVGDPNNPLFGTAVSISGDTAVVGVPVFFNQGDHVPGAAFVFERNHGGASGWAQVATLSADTAMGLTDQFGLSVAISGDTIVVGAVKPYRDTQGQFVALTSGTAHVFERNQGGPNRWGE